MCFASFLKEYDLKAFTDQLAPGDSNQMHQHKPKNQSLNSD